MTDRTTRLRILGDNQSRQAFREIRRDIASVSDRIGRLDNDIKVITAAFVTFQAAIRPAFTFIRDQISALTSTGADFEILQRRLDALTGSVEGGARAFEFINDFTRSTPLQLNQVTDAFIRLKAFGIDPTNGSLQAITDGALKYTGTSEGLQGVILAVGQAWAKQKLQGEEINQLVERGIPVWELLERVTGRNTVELQELSSAGQIGRREIALLIEELGKSSIGAAAEQMNTFSGQLSNANDNLAQFRKEIADSGYREFLTGVLRQLNIEFERLRQNGQLAAIARRISDALVSIAQFGIDAVNFLIDFRREIGFVIRIATALVAVKIGAYLIGVGKAALAATAGFRGLFKAVNPVLLAFIGFESLRTFFPDLFADIVDAAKKAMFALVAQFQKAAIDVEAAWDKTLVVFKSGWQSALKFVANEIISFTQAILDQIGDAARALGLDRVASSLEAGVKRIESIKFDTSGLQSEIKKIEDGANAAKAAIDDTTTAIFGLIDADRNVSLAATPTIAPTPIQAVSAQTSLVDQASTGQLDAAKEFKKIEEQIKKVLEDRKLTLDEIQLKLEAGAITQTQAQSEIDAANRRIADQLAENIAKGRQFAEALSGSDRTNAEGVLLRAEAALKRFATTQSQVSQSINRDFAAGFTNAFDNFITGAQSAGDAFRSFASDFLRQIARMILQQTVLNTLQAASGNPGALLAGLFHQGGVVGSGGRAVSVPAFAFAGAPRYHSGGLAGLAPNEVPAVLQMGEEVLTRKDPRHIANSGGSPSPQSTHVKVINTIDAGSFISEGLASAEGGDAIMNYIRANSGSIKQMLS